MSPFRTFVLSSAFATPLLSLAAWPAIADREARTALIEGTALLAHGEAKSALPLLQKAAHTLPADAGAQLALGRALLRQERALDALPPLQRAVFLAPADADARRALARALVSTGRPDAALAEADAAFRLSGDAETQRLRGRALEGLGRFEDALTAYRDALRLGAGDVASRRALGVALVNASHERHAAAIALALRTGAALPPPPAGDLASAALLLESAVRDDAADASGWVGWGTCLLAQARPRDARSAFDRALKIAPASSRAHEGLGLALIALSGQASPGPREDIADTALSLALLGTGIEELREALRLDPQHGPWPELAAQLATLGRLREASELIHVHS